MADDEKWGLSREEINERIEKQNQKHKKKGKGRSENQRLKLLGISKNSRKDAKREEIWYNGTIRGRE